MRRTTTPGRVVGPRLEGKPKLIPVQSEEQPICRAGSFRLAIVLIIFAALVAFYPVVGGVVNASGGGSAASLAPSGTAAFFLKGNGRRYVALASLVGGKTRVVALPPAAAKDDVDELRMDFSRDGRTVSFLAGGSFFVVDAHTARLQRTFSSRELGRGAVDASLSPDGRRVAVIHEASGCGGNVSISVVAHNGPPKPIILPAAIRPSAHRAIEASDVVWAPDGRSITLNVEQYPPLDCRTNTLSGAFLYRLRVTGKGHVKLREASDFLFTPRWAPDGSLLGYIEGNMYLQSASDVFVVRPDGSKRRRLTHFGSGQGGDQGISFAWSRTGHLFVAHVRGNGFIRRDVGLYDVDPRSGSNRRFSQFESQSVLAVSADGQLVAVAGWPGVVILSVADGKIRRRTRLISPRSGLRLEDYSPVAAAFSP